jgi:hypothetical protein
MPLNHAFIAAPLAALIVGSSLSLAIAQNTQRSTLTTTRQTLFIITDQEGYGTGECLERQGGCGRIIANSFCESKGFKTAEFYRKAAAEDVTGSIASERKPAPRDPQAFVIGCK